MKAYEENWGHLIWMHDHNQRPIWAVDSANNKRPGTAPGALFEFNDPDERDAAMLAAAAPDMARLLLPGAVGQGTHFCIPRDALIAVLVKAGVLKGSDT